MTGGGRDVRPATLPPRLGIRVLVASGGASLAAYAVSMVALGALGVLPERAVVLGLSVVPTLIAVLPPLAQFMLRRFDALHPMNFVALSSAVGVTGRTHYVALTANEAARDHILYGQPLEFLVPGILVIVFGLGAMVATFVTAGGRRSPDRDAPAPNRRERSWSRSSVVTVMTVLVLISAVSSAIFIDRIGLEPLDVLRGASTKRFVTVDAGRGSFASLGYLRWGSSLAGTAFLLGVAYLAANRRRGGVAVPLLTGAALGVTSIVPIVSSTRADLLALALSAVIVWHYLRTPLTLRRALLGLAAAAMVLAILGGARGGSLASVDVGSELRSTARELFAKRNWLGVGKTAHIVDAIPDRLAYRNGATLVGWIAAPVPRTLWPGKPEVRSGRWVSIEVYGEPETRRTGTPPGLIAEAYMNGGVVLVLLLAAGLGVVLRRAYDWQASSRGSTRTARTFVYATLLPTLTLTALAGDVSGTIVVSITQLVSVYATLVAIGALQYLWPALKRGALPDVRSDGHAPRCI